MKYKKGTKLWKICPDCECAFTVTSEQKIYCGEKKDKTSCTYLRIKKNKSVSAKKCHEKNPEKHKNSVLKSKFNISLEDFKNLILIQNNKCKICSKESKLVIDHNHTNGKIRGLLCDSCNKGLGFFKDKIESLSSAINYLNKNEI